jgi:hypothetical protein
MTRYERLMVGVLIGLAAAILAGCSRKPTTPKWLIESYSDGVVTVRHEGNTYKARCNISRSFNNADSVTDPSNVHMFHTCDLAVGLVGQSVQPFGGKQKDASGWTINMWSVGSTIVLRSWRDEHTPWRQDEFLITSVTKNAP